jgi:hypothetical protein
MTKEELATRITGREIGDEVETDECLLAKESGLVIVYGASDDLTELRGAIDEEFGYGEILFTKDGKQIDEDDMEVLEKYNAVPPLNKIHADYTREGWEYTTEIPHATFEIMEDGELYCRGIVFGITDLA